MTKSAMKLCKSRCQKRDAEFWIEQITRPSKTPGVGNCYVEAHVDPYELADSDDGELFAVRILVVFSTT